MSACEKVKSEMVVSNNMISKSVSWIRGSSPLGSGGREASSNTDRHVSWIEEAIKDVQRQEASRRCFPSMEDLVFSAGFSSMTEEEVSWEDRRVGFSSVIEGVTYEIYCTRIFI
jgi:hypothetical protein